ncbi:hypothetical protein B0A48_01261 [Cryoendolithus antarcticus]|uniref:Uncharacterized protein n=1 Tax=Cryoendolithus antarcticus TaxID=1507870 RepID=A0A1V8TSP5_9PEZI|nr:hypothetical protein B0A48_01261 [Cryoendolithus antarcticus]
MARLTRKDSSATDSPSSYAPLPDLHFSELGFPDLEHNGTVIDTRPPPGERTPPAALSSQRLANMEASMTSLSDDYDMVDDASTCETVSIADESSDEEENMTPDASSDIDVEETKPDVQRLADSVVITDDAQQGQARRETLGQSYLSEDLETPRQSTMYQFPHVDNKKPNVELSKPISNYSPRRDLLPFAKVLRVTIMLAPLLLLLSVYSLFPIGWMHPPSDLTLRRTQLAEISASTGYPESYKYINATFLLPEPTLVGHGSFGRSIYGVPGLTTQRINNTLFVSLPKNVSQASPSTSLWKVKRAGATLQTAHYTAGAVIDGVVYVTMEPQEAHGILEFVFLRRAEKAGMAPRVYTTYSYFGRKRSLQQEIREEVSKEVTAARSVVHSLASNIGNAVGAGALATTHVTTELATQLSRELSLFVNTAGAVFSKASAASNQTSQALRKEAQEMGRDFILISNELSTFVNNTTYSIQRAIREPLLLSRERAVMLRDGLIDRVSRSRAAMFKDRLLNRKAKTTSLGSPQVMKAPSMLKKTSCQAGKCRCRKGKMAKGATQKKWEETVELFAAAQPFAVLV